MEKKQKTQQKIMVIIVAIVVIAGLAYVFSKAQNSTTYQNPSTLTNSVTTNDGNAGGGSDNSTKSLLSYDGSVIYDQVEDGTTTIYTKTAQSEARVIFTDKDENDKIKFIGGLTSSGEILGVLAPAESQFGGSLYLIKTDGSGTKTKTIDGFASPQAPSISPDGRLIGYVLFSNTEANYGFSLYIMNTSGSNKIKIDQDSTMLANIAWSADSQKIAYVKGNNPEATITVSNIDATNQSEIYQIPEGQTITSLNWNSNNLIVSQNSISKTPTAEVLSIEAQSKKTNGIYKSSQYIAQSLWASKEENNFFFLTGDKNNSATPYTLSIATLNGELANLGNAMTIIGWQQ